MHLSRLNNCLAGKKDQDIQGCDILDHDVWGEQHALRLALRSSYRMDEALCVEERVQQAALSLEARQEIRKAAYQAVSVVRERSTSLSGVDVMMLEYGLSTHEGLMLMRLAEALLRIPDSKTRNKLIEDKIGSAEWRKHLWSSKSWFVNSSTFGLMMAGKVVSPSEGRSVLFKTLKGLIRKSGEPIIREAIARSMQLLGGQFIIGQTIEEGRKRSREYEKKGYCHSYDMLGEGAMTLNDAEKYYQEYVTAIECIGLESPKFDLLDAPGISIKLSALHPRYEYSQFKRVMTELYEKVVALVRMAKDRNMAIFIDAEEADRLDISMAILEKLSNEEDLKGWNGFGLAIQAYQKRCVPLIDFLTALGKHTKRRFLVRLVKGAYWDTEIKRAQEGNLHYPVFTKKVNTDVSYLACARKLLSEPDCFYPCFATHNAYTQAAVMHIAGELGSSFEFQKLYGMGDTLYDYILGLKGPLKCPDRVRVYAPVGDHEKLLPYLVRRLLENGANSSFVNQMVDPKESIDDIISDPIAEVEAADTAYHRHLPFPEDIFGKRKNSQGLDITDPLTLGKFEDMLEKENAKKHDIARWHGSRSKDVVDVKSPINHEVVGGWSSVTEQDLDQALDQASKGQNAWNALGAGKRAEILRKAADLYEEHMAEASSLLMNEAGKILEDCVAEVREAVDFLRYYADQAESIFKPKDLPGVTGETNRLYLNGRGVFFCVSPWNFPLAIFTGQVAAALATGNAVLAKPSEQTPLIASLGVSLLHKAGVPKDVLHLIPGSGSFVGGKVLPDARLSGVVFTGSTETAHIINRTLAERRGALLPFIAETGGQNAMIVDSSALPEQVTRDVLMSAFRSAGQRCSALRVLFIQEDVYDKQLKMIKDAAQELRVSDPRMLKTDVGPVIDADALQMLKDHEKEMDEKGRFVFKVDLADDCPEGYFFTPVCYEIDHIGVLEKETFGPFLHVVKYKRDDLDKVIQSIHDTHYGLTLSVHSRVDQDVEHIIDKMHVGNLYVNRNQIGAVVEAQPFGGEGLSGTGPKAGGPHYLFRFVQEKTVSIDVSAAGGNADLLALSDK